jgi:hypothetical protein
VTTVTATSATPTADGPGPMTDRLAHDQERGTVRRAGDLLASEWIKLWSVRSTYLALLAAAIVAPLIAVGVAQGNVGYIHRGADFAAKIRIDPLAMSFRGMAVAQLIVGVLGALTITSEHGSGLIRTTFAAKPQREAVFAAKLAVLAAVVAVFAELLVLGCFAGTQAVLNGTVSAGQRLGLAFGAPGVLPTVLSAGAYLVVVALVGAGIGALVRHTAAAIAGVVVFFFLLPQLPGALPAPWSYDFANAFPSTAAQQLASLNHSPQLLSVGASWAVLAAYAVGFPLVGTWALLRRDA